MESAIWNMRYAIFLLAMSHKDDHIQKGVAFILRIIG